MDYEAFFKLKERPFKNPWEAKFYFRVPAFDEIRETLINAPRPEFLILRGQPGVGKSALLRRLPWALKEKTVVAPILLTGHRLGDILRDALIGFGLGFKCSPQVPDESLLGFFQNAVSNFIANNYGLALAADGAATLTEEDVEDLLRLLSLEPKWRGQTTLLATDALKSPWPGPKFPGAKTLTLPPLDRAQTAEYVRFRLQAAGGKKDLFPQESLHKVHALSEGSPAAINALCERALLTAWAAGKKEIAPHFLTQAKASLENPLEIAPQAKRRAAGYSRDRQKIRSTPIRLALAASLALVFSLGFVFWPKSDETGPEKAIAKPAATQALPAAPVETATPAADPASMGPKTGLSLPTPPPILLSLPHNANALVVDQSSGQARLWRGQLRTTGLKAELVAPELAEPGLYLMGRPKSRMSLVFQYPPGREVPPEVGEKLWRQVETLLPQDILPLLVADGDLLGQPVPPGILEILKDKLKTWTTAQEVQYTDELAHLYADPFVYYEPGQKPQTIDREAFQVALASEAKTSGDVRLAVSEPVIALDPRNHNRAWAVFNLRYDSRLRRDLGLRTLIFEKTVLGDDWLIRAELWIRENSLRS